MRKPFLTALTVAAITGIGVTGYGVISQTTAQAATGASTTASTTKVKPVPRYTRHEVHSQAVAKVLGMSVDQLETALKTKSMKTILADHHLTRDSFKAKVKQQVASDLRAKGYSDAQINAHPAHRGHHRQAAAKH